MREFVSGTVLISFRFTVLWKTTSSQVIKFCKIYNVNTYSYSKFLLGYIFVISPTYIFYCIKQIFKFKELIFRFCQNQFGENQRNLDWIDIRKTQPYRNQPTLLDWSTKSIFEVWRIWIWQKAISLGSNGPKSRKCKHFRVTVGPLWSLNGAKKFAIKTSW